MPISNVHCTIVQPAPALPDLQHCHVAEHIANWLVGSCGLAHNLLFLAFFEFGGLFNVADFCDRIYLSLICLLNLLDILGQRNLGCQRLLKTFYNHKTFF